MKIKVTNSDADKARLLAALAQINGAATAHTAGAWDCIDQAQKAEAHLEALGLNKKDRAGAVRVYISGERVSNSYMRKGYSDRVATRIRLERGSTCWYVTSIARTAVGQNGGWSRTRLTVKQCDSATARFQSQFSVLQVPVPVLMVAADMAIIKATGGEA